MPKLELICSLDVDASAPTRARSSRQAGLLCDLGRRCWNRLPLPTTQALQPPPQSPPHHCSGSDGPPLNYQSSLSTSRILSLRPSFSQLAISPIHSLNQCSSHALMLYL
ncbi:hypothetical protein M758_UG159800 [Ceratodon purpureus]|nr:hypothetical protein M758_UG159800 [Ceratodon purpureus]